MPRSLLPADDLYARLELPVDASYEAVEVAWRALLKRHHPDVAGGAVDADERAKRINVAHDWLSDPDLRDRYDRERHPTVRSPRPRGRSVRWNGAAAQPRPAPSAAAGGRRPLRRRPLDAEEALARHLERVERLTPDEIDRLNLAEAPPIAFVASIARFLPKDLLATLESVEQRVHDHLPRAVRWNPGVRDSAVGFGQEIVLARFLDEHLSGDFRERVRERLTRGWTVAVDQPRYGPNGTAVAAAIAALQALPAGEIERLVAAATPARQPARSGVPWPPGIRPDEDDALRVSSELARRDAVAALPPNASAAARRSLERAIHALVLRHAFPAPVFDDLVRPWRASLRIADRPRPGIRSTGHPRS